MTDLDRLGTRHKKLLVELAELRSDIAAAIRAERVAGATYVDLMNRSGYTSIETIRQIVDQSTRDRVNKSRRGA